VLGCLIEKRWTTPDQYPLSLNALRLAANQATNRDPVTSYNEAEIRAAADRLCRYGLARLASGHGSRAVKYRHLAEEALELGREELAILCVLLLRGPQTPGELKARSGRMAHLSSLDDVERVLGQLQARGYCERLPRRPGQKEDRYRHLLAGADSGELPAAARDGAPPASIQDPTPPAAAPDAGHGAPPHAGHVARSDQPDGVAVAQPGEGGAPAGGPAHAAPAPVGLHAADAPVGLHAAAPSSQPDTIARLEALASRVAAVEAQLASLQDLKATVASLRERLADLLD